MAPARCRPTRSFRNTTDISVIISGATKKSAVAVARGSVAMAAKISMLLTTTSSPRIRCSTGVDVLSARNPPSNCRIVSVMPSAMTERMKIIWCSG